MYGVLHKAECWVMSRYKEIAEWSCYQGAHTLLEELTGTNDYLKVGGRTHSHNLLNTCYMPFAVLRCFVLVSSFIPHKNTLR